MNNQSIQVFDFEDHEVRITGSPQEPMFVAGDVCKALDHTNTSVAIQNLDEDEKGVSKVYTPGGEQEVNVVNEAGLYSLIFRSNKPEAKKFKRWVTHEVLPSIRKLGFYNTEVTEDMIDELVAKLKQRRKELINEAQQLQQQHYERIHNIDAQLARLGHHVSDNLLTNQSLARSVNEGRSATKYEVEKAIQNGEGIMQFLGVNNWRSVRRWADKLGHDWKAEKQEKGVV